MQFGPYILEEQVGRGAMAEVWSGWHAARSERVAIKIVTRLAGHAEKELDAFFHEVRTVASLSHPGIVRILDYGQAPLEGVSEAAPYLVTELARGGTLGTGWRAGTFADVRRALNAILDALAHAHARGVIHRDLKPGNVLRITADPEAPLRVTDFGIAQLAPMGERSWADELIAGTPKYMAPEQVRGDWRDHGPWTDLYAVGCIGWAMVTGRPPFEGAREEVYRHHLEADPGALVPLLAIPDAFEEWLRWLLAKDIAARCGRAADASMELLGLQMPDDPHTIEVSMLLDEPSTSTFASSDEMLVSSIIRPSDRVERLRQMASASRALSAESMHTELRLWGLRRTPFVGRRRERTQLWSALQRAFEAGAAQLVVIEGAPGTGKSTLARWLTERSHELGLAEPLVVLHDPVSRQRDGLHDALARVFRIEDLGVAEAVSRIHRALARHLGEAEALTHAGVLGDWVAADDDRSMGFESEERAAALLAVLRVLGTSRVPLLWIDHADRAAHTLRTLARALELAGDDPPRVMLVATIGDVPEEGARDALSLLRGSCTTLRLELGPLEPEEARDLLDEMLPLAPRFRDDLIRQTSGNPLLAVQMLGALISNDRLAMNERGEFEVRDGAVAASSFAALLDMRIAALAQYLDADGAIVREQLEIAAALGRTVRPVEWLVATGKHGMPVRRSIVDALVRSGLAVPADECWAFAHDLIRVELVDSARRRGRWARFNRLCAEVLEDLYPHPDPERRAAHLLEAGTWSLAADACLAAAEASLRGRATRRAQSWLVRATQALDDGGAPDDDVRRAAVRVMRTRLAM